MLKVYLGVTFDAVTSPSNTRLASSCLTQSQDITAGMKSGPRLNPGLAKSDCPLCLCNLHGLQGSDDIRA